MKTKIKQTIKVHRLRKNAYYLEIDSAGHIVRYVLTLYKPSISGSDRINVLYEKILKVLIIETGAMFLYKP